MELEHSFTIPVPPQQAWQVLLNVEEIAPCMPGATVDSVDGDVVSGRIKVKVGPVALTYAGTARFVERDDEKLTVTLEASGKETRGSGTASAKVRSSLRDEGGQTRVVVHTTMSVTGRPAQFGRGVMAEVGGRIIEKFATNLAAHLASAGQQAAVPAEGNGAGPGTAVPGPAAAAGPAGPAEAAEAARALSIEELNLPVRAYNSLRREGIHTVGDLSARSEPDLLAIENLGPQSVKEIKLRLADHGLALTGTAAAGPPTPAAPAGDAAASTPAAAASADGAGAATAATGPAAADRATGPGAGAGEPAQARAARPPDEDAIDLLSVAGFPVLKRALPAAGALVALLLLVLRVRRRRRRRSG